MKGRSILNRNLITINQRRTGTNQSLSNVLLNLSYSQSLWSGRTENKMLGISSKSISSRKQIIEFAYLFAIISQYFWDILFHYLVNSFVVTSFLYSYNDSCHGDLGNIFQNLFGCLSHDLPKLLHSVQILIYKLTVNKHSRSFIQITTKNGRVGGLCVKVTCFVWRKEEGRGSCPEKQPLSSTIFCCYDH